MAKYIYLAMSCGMQDINSQPGIEPVPPAVEAQSPNHWTTREFPSVPFFILTQEVPTTAT